MATTITWLGHNAWSIEAGGRTILVDPFLDDSPTSPVKVRDVKADYILLSHGHGDHLGDTVAIAKRTDATVITNFEVGQWLGKKGVDGGKIIEMNPGGGIRQPFGHVKFTIAHHSSSMPDGSYGGVPGGFLLTLGELRTPGDLRSDAGAGSGDPRITRGDPRTTVRVYFACDTALFLDMKLIGGGGLDLAVVPIGDLYTMGPDDSIDAIKLLNPKQAAPCHYNTWPPIAQDAAAWAEQVRSHTASEPIVLEPGGRISL